MLVVLSSGSLRNFGGNADVQIPPTPGISGGGDLWEGFFRKGFLKNRNLFFDKLSRGPVTSQTWGSLAQLLPFTDGRGPGQGSTPGERLSRPSLGVRWRGTCECTVGLYVFYRPCPRVLCRVCPHASLEF